MDVELLNQLDRRGRSARWLVQIGLRHSKIVVLFWVFVVVAAGAAVTELKIETSTDSILNRDSLEWSFYQRSQNSFGGDEVVTIALAEPVAISSEFLVEIQSLSESLAGISGVRRVDSVSTVPLIRASEGGGVSLEPGFRLDIVPTDTEAKIIGADLKADRIAPRFLVSEDGRFFAINLVLENGSETQYEEILDQAKVFIGSRSVWISGVPIFRTETDKWTRTELVRLVPVTVIVLFLMSMILVRDPVLSLIPIVTSGIGSLSVLAVMASSGTPLTISTVILPSILMALGCAYSMHFIIEVFDYGWSASTIQRIEHLSLPIALSALTTTLGFLAIGFVQIPSIQDVSRFGALGVMILLLVNLTMVPLLLRMFARREREVSLSKKAGDFASKRLIGFAVGHSREIVGAWLAVLVVSGIGLFKLQVQTDVILWFPKDHSIRRAYEEIRSKFSGISPINVVIESVGSDSVTSPGAYSAIRKFQSFLETQEEIGKVISYADPIAQIDAILGEQTPVSGDRIEQYLLLLESSPILADLVTPDRLSANIAIRVNQNGSDVLLDVARRAENWWAQHGSPSFVATVTGIMFEFARSQESIARGQLVGMLFVLASVGAILVLILREPRLVSATLAVNAIPIIIGFGAMGLLGVAIDAGTVVVGSIAFGIAVDDSIHAATEYSRGIAIGETPEFALRAAYRRILRPVVYTTLCVSSGFFVLGSSDFVLIRNLGFVTGIVLWLCLLADLTLFPAAVLIGSRPVSTPDAVRI